MMNPVIVRLPDETKEILVQKARKQKQSLAEIIRRAIIVSIKDEPVQKSGAEVLLEWVKENKHYPSKFKDKNLSTTYKKYLYGGKK